LHCYFIFKEFIFSPNICKIKEVFGTGERFYQGFTDEKPKRIKYLG
jgi:hypothetical protein